MEEKEFFTFIDGVTRADIAIYCKAQTVEKIFYLNSLALLHICLNDPQNLKKLYKENLTVSQQHYDALLIKYINELIFIKDTKGLLLLPENIKIYTRENNFLYCEAELWGDYISNGYDVNIDPKAATFHKVKCEKTNDSWESMVVIDV